MQVIATVSAVVPAELVTVNACASGLALVPVQAVDAVCPEIVTVMLPVVELIAQ